MKPIIIAEIAQGHDGSLGLAKSFASLAKEVGAEFVKFQTHFAFDETSEYDTWRVKFSEQDKSRFDYWQRIEFSDEDWINLAHHCEGLGIGFISSPFSIRAVNLLEKLDIPFYKIASGEVNNIPMLHAIRETGKDVLVSTGLSDHHEVKSLVDFFGSEKVTLLHCISEYPTPPERTFLENINKLKEMYPKCKVGLSDHSGTVFPSIIAMHSQIDVLELHLTFDKKMFGPDVLSSLTPDQFANVVRARGFIHKMMNSSPTDMHAYQDGKSKMKQLFGHSAFAARAIQRGEIITTNDISMKKPGIGLP
jgi:N,N'-diacetyllegionaminate synthase